MSRIMAHMVACYPDQGREMEVAEGLVAGGASYLEIQFPFSDPTADGPVIDTACGAALAAGFTLDAGFRFVKAVCEQFQVPVFIMSYAGPVFARGVERFLNDGCDSGASGFILPDLPMDYDEGAFAEARRIGTEIVPVTVPTMTDQRVGMLGQVRPSFVYAALRQGITGERTEIGPENLRFLGRIAGMGAKILAGFGIAERAQVEVLEPLVHAVVVGSALVRTVTTAVSAGAAIREAVAQKVGELVGTS